MARAKKPSSTGASKAPPKRKRKTIARRRPRQAQRFASDAQPPPAPEPLAHATPKPQHITANLIGSGGLFATGRDVPPNYVLVPKGGAPKVLMDVAGLQSIFEDWFRAQRKRPHSTGSLKFLRKYLGDGPSPLTLIRKIIQPVRRRVLFKNKPKSFWSRKVRQKQFWSKTPLS